MQWYDNPGAVLLCYAMQQKLNELGYENIVIDYASGGGVHKKKTCIIFSKVKKILNYFTNVRIVNGQLYGFKLANRYFLYEKFRHDYLSRTRQFTDKESIHLKGYKKYIVGSDVVWKPSILNSYDSDVYFLSFVEDELQKISFAASIGTSDEKSLLENKDKYKDKLESFRYISVREESTAQFLTKYLHRDVKCILDPVFLLKNTDYAKIATNPKKGEKYIYFYMLELNDMAIEYALGLAHKRNIPIVYDLHSNDILCLEKRFGKTGKASIAAGPAEFLAQILNADYIVTNSFHGTAFSIIFEKEFSVFSCCNNGIDVSLRMTSLLSQLELNDRFNPKIGEEMNPIDYIKVKRIIDSKIKESIDFLKEALSQ